MELNIQEWKGKTKGKKTNSPMWRGPVGQQENLTYKKVVLHIIIQYEKARRFWSRSDKNGLQKSALSQFLTYVTIVALFPLGPAQDSLVTASRMLKKQQFSNRLSWKVKRERWWITNFWQLAYRHICQAPFCFVMRCEEPSLHCSLSTSG